MVCQGKNIDLCSKSFTYYTSDAIGNPLSYYNGYSFTWEKGRELHSATNGTDTITYVYDHEGRRAEKTVNGVTSRYTWEGDKVLFEKNGDTSQWYYYDEEGSPIAIKVRTVIHPYRKDLQGDITGIYSGLTGELLVSYVYDAWGKPTVIDEAGTEESAELCELNPYLYRGYRYDHETGLYYLRSRYYDPETGRFVNADIFVSTNQGILSANMFAYCLNNPVNYTDRSGQGAEEIAAGWGSLMWWLTLADGPIPIGDIIYAGGL